MSIFIIGAAPAIADQSKAKSGSNQRPMLQARGTYTGKIALTPSVYALSIHTKSLPPFKWWAIMGSAVVKAANRENYA
jgi:hypothetical protein